MDYLAVFYLREGSIQGGISDCSHCPTFAVLVEVAVIVPVNLLHVLKVLQVNDVTIPVGG